MTTGTKNGSSGPKKAATTPPPPPGPLPPYGTPEWRREVIRRASAGDRSVLPQLRELLREPRLIEELQGDLAADAQRRLVEAMTGDNLAVREAMLAKVAAVRADLLAGGGGTAIEALIVERCVAGWLGVNEAELRFVHVQKTGGPDGKPASYDDRRLEYLERRVTQRSRRYLLALRALATVRRFALA